MDQVLISQKNILCMQAISGDIFKNIVMNLYRHW